MEPIDDAITGSISTVKHRFLIGKVRAVLSMGMYSVSLSSPTIQAIVRPRSSLQERSGPQA